MAKFQIESTPQGCQCQACQCFFLGDLMVPNRVWAQIKPPNKPEGGGILCPNCIMNRIVKQGIWAAGFALDDGEYNPA